VVRILRSPVRHGVWLAAVASGGAGEGLEGLLADPAVAQIVIAGPDAAFVDRTIVKAVFFKPLELRSLAAYVKANMARRN